MVLQTRGNMVERWFESTIANAVMLILYISRDEWYETKPNKQAHDEPEMVCSAGFTMIELLPSHAISNVSSLR